MAVTKRNANIQTFDPNWPQALSADRVRFTYDRPTDTLFVDFYGEPLPAAIPLDRGDRDYLFLRIDPDTEAVVGLQIEQVLSYAIARHPELVAALDAAKLVGIDREALRRMTRSGPERLKADDAAALIANVLRLSA